VPQLKVGTNGILLEDSNDITTAKQAEQNDRVLRSQRICKDGAKEHPEVPISVQNQEQLIWSPLKSFMISGGLNNEDTANFINDLSDTEIDQFLIIAKSVGTYARALDCNNAFKQPSLPLSAASASRDITLVIFNFISINKIIYINLKYIKHI
jgi:hypothetical protein